MKAMLYRDGTPAEVTRMMGDKGYVAEPKYDGVRCLVRYTGGKATLLNRQGKPLAAGAGADRAAVAADFTTLGLRGDWLFDGELVGSTLYLFDMVAGVEGAITPDCPFTVRGDTLRKLDELANLSGTATLRVADQAVGTEAKAALLEQVKADGGEGIMLKSLDAPYVSGRSDRGGVKVKLTRDVDLIVTAVGEDGKSNATLAAVRDGKLVEVGRCSTIGKGKVQVGDVVEVRFLYVGANGRLVQPRMMRVRTDKVAAECGINQIAA